MTYCTFCGCPCTSGAVIEVHEQGLVEEVVDHVEPPVESEVKHEPCESNVRLLCEVRNFVTSKVGSCTAVPYCCTGASG